MNKTTSKLVIAVMFLLCVLALPSMAMAQGTDQVTIIGGQEGITLYVNQFNNVVAECLVDMNPIGERKYLLRVERIVGCEVVEIVDFYSEEPQADYYCQYNFAVEFAIHFASMEADFWTFTAILQTVEGVQIDESVSVEVTFS